MSNTVTTRRSARPSSSTSPPKRPSSSSPPGSPRGGRCGRTPTEATRSRTSSSSPGRRPALRGDRRRRAGLGLRMLAWEPPHRLLLDWQIGEARGTEVEVTFAPEGPGSRVVLEHRGFATPTYRAGATTSGWDAVLGDLRRERVEEGLKPAQPLGPGHRRVGRRGRGKHEERRLAEAALLQSELRPLPKAPRYASLPTKPIARGVSSSAIRSSRSAEPAKSALRRSPEPGVVR